MTRLPKIALFCAFLGAHSPLHAQGLFDRDTPVDIVLTGPIESVLEQREERSDWPFRMEVNGRESSLQIRARGNSRMRLCDFPPLKFDFRQSESVDATFAGLTSLKLVMPCKRSDRSAGDVMEEYAVYRIFNLLTDVSLRVRLLHFTFDGTDGRLDKSFREGYGFFIEPIEHMAARVAGQRADVPAVSLASLDQRQAALVFVFQYLVANTDWSLVAPESRDRCCHNIELVDIDSRRYLVPYDFDLAGLVNAGYARPDRSLRITTVRHRLYRGFCIDRDVLRDAIIEIASKEDEVIDLINGLPLLSGKEKANRLNYLGKFFKLAGDGDKLLESFEGKCLS